MKKKCTFGIYSMLFLVSCLNNNPSSPQTKHYSILVYPVDTIGNPFMADSVLWYYVPNTAKYDGEHKAECIKNNNTTWGIDQKFNIGDTMYVIARYARPYSDTFCLYSAYDAARNIITDTIQDTIRLVMEIHLMCQ